MVTYFVPAAAIPDDVYTNMGGGGKVSLALIPNVALWWGIKVMASQEGSGQGSQFSNLFDRMSPNDPITMGVVWIMLIVDIFVYGFITWYLDSVKPGQYGVAQKWYFLFQVTTFTTKGTQSN